MCGGVQIHVKDREMFEPYLTGIAVISAARALYPEEFEWRNPPYEYEQVKLPIEILCGGAEIPQMIRDGIPLDKVRQSWQDDLASFISRRKPYLIYG